MHWQYSKCASSWVHKQEWWRGSKCPSSGIQPLPWHWSFEALGGSWQLKKSFTARWNWSYKEKNTEIKILQKQTWSIWEIGQIQNLKFYGNLTSDFCDMTQWKQIQCKSTDYKAKNTTIEDTVVALLSASWGLITNNFLQLTWHHLGRVRNKCLLSWNRKRCTVLWGCISLWLCPWGLIFEDLWAKSWAWLWDFF